MILASLVARKISLH